MKRSRALFTEIDDLHMVLRHMPPFPAAVGVVARLRQVNRQFSANGPFWFRVPGRWQFGSNAADQMPVMRSLMAHGKTDAMLRALGYRGLATPNQVERTKLLQKLNDRTYFTA